MVQASPADVLVSTHSRPKAAGFARAYLYNRRVFQHTAARRRLVDWVNIYQVKFIVSTHSRPKAAGPLTVDVYYT